MTTDDAPRLALDAATIEEGRRLLAAATPGPYSLSAEHNAMGYDIDPLPQGLRYGMDRVEDARAICWLLRHADALLAAAAERDKLAGQAARYRAALRAIERGAAATASVLLSSQTAPVLSGSLERIIQRCRAALAPAAGEGAGDGD